MVLGNYNALFIFTRNKDTMSWEDKGVTKVSTRMYVCMYGGRALGSRLRRVVLSDRDVAVVCVCVG